MILQENNLLVVGIMPPSNSFFIVLVSLSSLTFRKTQN